MKMKSKILGRSRAIRSRESSSRRRDKRLSLLSNRARKGGPSYLRAARFLKNLPQNRKAAALPGE